MTVSGQMMILPTMYLALSYDHYLIDGKETVSLLVAIGDLLGDPARLLLDAQFSVSLHGGLPVGSSGFIRIRIEI